MKGNFIPDSEFWNDVRYLSGLVGEHKGRCTEVSRHSDAFREEMERMSRPGCPLDEMTERWTRVHALWAEISKAEQAAYDISVEIHNGVDFGLDLQPTDPPLIDVSELMNKRRARLFDFLHLGPAVNSNVLGYLSEAAGQSLQWAEIACANISKPMGRFALERARDWGNRRDQCDRLWRSIDSIMMASFDESKGIASHLFNRAYGQLNC